MRHRIAKQLASPFKRFVVSATVLMLCIQALVYLFGQYQLSSLRNADHSAFFDYSVKCDDGRRQPVQFEGVSQDGDGNWRINTSSCSWFKKEYPVTFVDRLYCAQVGTDIYSLDSTITDEIEVARVTDYYTVKKWFYAKPFPSGSVCYIQSTITMHIGTIDKSESIKSDPFIPEKPKGV